MHCDLNGFFASVEALDHPEVLGKPMAVSGNPRNRHGVILAKNEEAKKFGISTGESILSAKKKCPHLILLEAHHDKYEHYSRLTNRIYARYTDRVEPFGIDESWLDVTASEKLFGDGKTIADTLRRVVKEELGLTISVGVSYNKIFAKLASDYKKPDATTVFAPKDYEMVVRKLPVSSMLFVGPSSAETLGKMGIRTIGELADADDLAIERRFGKSGISLLKCARGLDNSPVGYYGEEDEAKSIGNSITFKRDLSGNADIKLGFRKVAEKVSFRLKEAGFECRCVHITVKGSDFSVTTRQMGLETPTNSMRALESAAFDLFQKTRRNSLPVRMLGISASGLQPAGSPRQADMFRQQEDASTRRKSAAEDAFFNVRKKFGKACISFGLPGEDDIL